MAVELRIEKLVYGGKALARVDGRAALIPYVLPGETVTASLREGRARMLEGALLEVQTPAPERVEPPCPVFGRCGGCHYQHLSYEAQLDWKRRILLETLARLGKIEWAGPVEVIHGGPWGYRNRTRIRLRREQGAIRTGFYAPGSHDFVAADQCPINSPALNRAHAALAAMAHERRFPDFLREIELFTNETDVQLNVAATGRPVAKRFFDWCGERIEGFSAEECIDYPSGGDLFRVSGRSFFQVNRFLTAELARRAVGEARGETALDLYAGVGLFTLPLARRCEQVTGVDSSRAATRMLQFNAGRAAVPVNVVHRGVEEFLSGYAHSPDQVIADPPRSGLGRSVTAHLIRLRPRRLTVVSCDPATLARDLRALCGAGFSIEALILADLFPQTFHIETIAHLAAR